MNQTRRRNKRRQFVLVSARTGNKSSKPPGQDRPVPTSVISSSFPTLKQQRKTRYLLRTCMRLVIFETHCLKSVRYLPQHEAAFVTRDTIDRASGLYLIVVILCFAIESLCFFPSSLDAVHATSNVVWASPPWRVSTASRRDRSTASTSLSKRASAVRWIAVIRNVALKTTLDSLTIL